MRPTMKLFYGIQYLRAFAAFIVVVHHAISWIPFYSDSQAWLYSYEQIKFWGVVGVDIFFVISGFIIAKILIATPPTLSNGLQFLKKRFLRVAPIYWVYTVLAAISFFIGSAGIDLIPKFLQSIFFIPRFENGVYQLPILPVGWTLTLEMFFYISAGICFLLCKKAWSIVLLVFIVLSFSVFDFSSIPALDWILASHYLLQFLLGVGLAYLLNKVTAISASITLTALFLGMIGLLLPLYLSDANTLKIIHSLTALLLVFAMIYIEPMLRKYQSLKILGDSSYTLYLSHPIVFAVLSLLHLKFQIHYSSAFILILVWTLIAMVASIVLYYLIEKPLIKLLAKK